MCLKVAERDMDNLGVIFDKANNIERKIEAAEREGRAAQQAINATAAGAASSTSPAP